VTGPIYLAGSRAGSSFKKSRTSGAKALVRPVFYGTAKPVPFVQNIFSPGLRWSPALGDHLSIVPGTASWGNFSRPFGTESAFHGNPGLRPGL